MLQNVTQFYIRAKFDRSFIETKILDVELEVGVEDLVGNELLDTQRTAKLVEKCSCPLGYIGTSCESCKYYLLSNLLDNLFHSLLLLFDAYG